MLLFSEMDEENAAYRHMKELRKRLRSIVEPFDLPNKEFIKKFRLSKVLVRELINDLTPYIAFGGHGGAVSIETKV